VFSLNVPLPPAVDALAADLAPRLVPFESVRDRHGLVCKRFGTADVGGETDRTRTLPRLRERLRPRLAGVDPFDVRATGLGAFTDPPTGPAPVVYLRIESAGLRALHDRLCRAFDPVPGIEGDDYVPHVTLARGGDRAAARELAEADPGIDPVGWRVGALDVYDPAARAVAATIRLDGPDSD